MQHSHPSSSQPSRRSDSGAHSSEYKRSPRSGPAALKGSQAVPSPVPTLKIVDQSAEFPPLGASSPGNEARHFTRPAKIGHVNKSLILQARDERSSFTSGSEGTWGRAIGEDADTKLGAGHTDVAGQVARDLEKSILTPAQKEAKLLKLGPKLYQLVTEPFATKTKEGLGLGKAAPKTVEDISSFLKNLQQVYPKKSVPEAYKWTISSVQKALGNLPRQSEEAIFIRELESYIGA